MYKDMSRGMFVIVIDYDSCMHHIMVLDRKISLHRAIPIGIYIYDDHHHQKYIL